MLDRRLGQDAMTEIEDEGPRAQRLEDRHRRAASSAAPPATSSTGSRLPCTGTMLLQSRPHPAERHGSYRSRSRRSRSPWRSARQARRRRAGSRSPGCPGRFALTSSTSRLVGATHQRSNSSSGRLPAQLSKICNTRAPAFAWSDEIVGRDLDQEIDQALERRLVAIGQQPRRGLVLLPPPSTM